MKRLQTREIMAGCALMASAACAYQVGDRMCGFEVTAVTPVPEVKGTLVRMTYPKSGADLVWLDRDDDNMTFSIAFRTIPEDDTGVAHILEHSVLCGSEKYPVKEPFVELLKSSFATFLNAWTSSDYTAYPVCSRNRKDFLNLIDVYMDAVLHPLSVKSPLPFRQEGWHYEVDEEGNFSRNGVVYSEMKGAFANPERLLYHELRRMLFPDNTYRFVSGGDPASIPDLTFEKYKDFYFHHYHPSNARIFLDGRVDLPAVLAKLDAYLAPYGRQAVDASVPFQKPISAFKTIAYEIAPGDNPADKTLVADSWVFASWKDREKGLAFDVLSDALADSNEAPLTKALLSRGLCEDVALWCGGNEQRAATFYAKNVKDGKADEVRRVMRETLESLAAKGLDHARIAAILDRHEFREREKDTGDTPRGLAYFSDAIEAWMYGGDPTEAFRHAHLYASLRAKLKTGWFEKFLRETLLENPHHVQLTMTPSATLAAERAAAEKKELASIKAGWSKERLEGELALARELTAFQKRPDAPEDLAKLPRLAVADVPVRGPERVQKMTQIDCGGTVPVLSPHTGANGITYVKLYFQLHGLTREELADVYLLTALMGELATRNHSALALRSEIDSSLGGFGVSVDVQGRSDGEAAAYVVVTASALEEKKDEIIRLAPEILLGTKFDDEKAIGKILRQLRRAKERGTMGLGARIYARRRAQAALSERGLRVDILMGLAQIRHLQKLDDAYAKDGAAICKRLDALRNRIFLSSRVALCCLADNTPADWARGLLATIPESSAQWRFAPYGLPPKVAEGFRTPGKVAFAAKSSRPGPYVGSSVVAARILSLDYLWNEIRVRGGAYGSNFHVRPDGDGGYLSWNDPKPGRTLGCYDKSGDALRAFAKSDAALDRYIVSAVASTEPYETPSTEVESAAMRFLQGRTPEDVQRLRGEMLRTTKGDLMKFADVLDGLTKDASICVIGGGEAFDTATNLLQRVESVQ